MLKDLKILTASMTNDSSSLLFFGKESLDNWMNSSSMGIVTVRGHMIRGKTPIRID